MIYVNKNDCIKLSHTCLTGTYVYELCCTKLNAIALTVITSNLSYKYNYKINLFIILLINLL